LSFVADGPYRYRLPQRGSMRVPGVVFASDDLLAAPGAHEPLQQVANVAELPGIVGASYAMPDMHWGYGFPIGGVAGTDVAAGGVVSPGGVGFDISCGVRLLASELHREDFRRLRNPLMRELDRDIVRGAGPGGRWQLDDAGQLDSVLRAGAQYAVEHGFGNDRDLDRCEDAYAAAPDDLGAVSDRARERGRRQLGSLGSGNHLLEVQAVDAVFDESTAAAFGLHTGQICVMIHCGSRGFGHQVCTDHVREIEAAMSGHGIEVPDRQLACAPVDSTSAQSYLDAMAAAAHYARANRQLLGDAARHAFRRTTDSDLEPVYDISHNMARLEHHTVDSRVRELCVHRKGATRALPPGHEDLPTQLRDSGQPVLVPGSMGTASYVLAGAAGNAALHSACHGAGRAQSRQRAARAAHGNDVRRELESAGIAVRGKSTRGLAEEAPAAYKDVSEVVAAAQGSGLTRSVARLVPLGVVKG